MFEITDGILTVTLQWWYIPIANAIYGLITHWISLPAIKRFNAIIAEGKEPPSLAGYQHPLSSYAITDWNLFWIMLGRMTIQMPIRIGAGVLGIILGLFTIVATIVAVPAIIVATGKINWSAGGGTADLRDAFKCAWAWYAAPEKLAIKFYNSKKPEVDLW